MNKRARGERVAVHVAVILLAVAVLAPFLWLLQMSVKTQEEIFAFPPKLVFAPTFENYRALWDSTFRRSFTNSAAVSVTSTALAMLLGVPGAYALSRARFRAAGQLSLWVLASRMAPPIAFTIPYFLVYRRLGLLEEAAWIDGASLRQSFMRIVLPLSAPGLAATDILCFLYAWNDFFFALILTRTAAMTAPVAVVNFMNYEGWEWGKIAAGGTLVMLPVLVFSFLVRNFLVRGLTAGALKG